MALNSSKKGVLLRAFDGHMTRLVTGRPVTEAHAQSFLSDQIIGLFI